jgi:TldD protein
MQAGAEWADIRLGDRRTYGSITAVTYSFGLRVRVGGVEAFVGGGDPTTDHLARAARSAVATARGLVSSAGGASRESFGLTPVPVVTGEWRAPMEIDPFAVSIDEHDHVNQTLNGMDDVRLAGLYGMGIRRQFGYSIRAETRVNASSEGSLLTQFLGDVMIEQNVIGKGNWRLRGLGEQLAVPFAGYGSCTAGFEVLAQLNRFEQVEQAAQELLRYETLPGGMIDVGRYPVVFDGSAHASLVQSALVPALSLRRVLGYDADLGGTSPWRPVAEVVGHQLFSPLLSLQIDHGPPAFGAYRWDAEGVAAMGGPLITNGTVVNYITTRATHAVLTSLLAARPQGGVSPLMGNAVATQASNILTELPTSLSVLPATTGSPNNGTLEALAKQLGTGLLVRGGDTYVNPEGTGGRTFPMMMFEVKGGQLVRRLYGASLQFSTKKLFKSLKAVGNASTLGERTQRAYMGFPESLCATSLTAPAALYAGVDVLNIS